jgi:hypothetical protein
MSDQRYTDALLANGKLREERDRLRSALEAYQNDHQNDGLWVSASTMKEDAPKDCEYFLVFRLGGEKIGEMAIQPDQIGLARYVPDDRTGWRLETNWQFGLSEPTHWMKIPAPPKAEEVAEAALAAGPREREGQ